VRVHDRHILFVLTEGEALVWCRGETHALMPGSLLSFEPGDVHRDLRKTSYRAVMVMVHGELATALCGAGERQVMGAALWRCPTLAAETVALVAAVRSGEACTVQEQRLARLFRSLAPRWTRKEPRPEPPLIARARRALTESSNAPLSLDELAGRLGCAPTYLCRMFSEHMGLGPHAYQLQHRLLEARGLIERGVTAAQAAVVTGFGDESHLSRHFRRRFAAGPGGYRRQVTGTITSRSS
jgi:AraC-like DNA-binding protein